MMLDGIKVTSLQKRALQALAGHLWLPYGKMQKHQENIKASETQTASAPGGSWINRLIRMKH